MTKPSVVASMVDHAIALQTPFFISGGVGIGKSQIVAQAAKKRGPKFGFSDVRVSQMDPTDIKGFPNPDHARKQMSWLPADFLPTKGEGILFFDELNSAPMAVQAACYQLFLDRKVGSYTLPPGWAIGAAGNRSGDRSIVNRMAAALANRMIHIDMEPDLDDFVAFARTQGFSDQNIGFLRFKSNLLHAFDAGINPVAFPTPRSWFTVDKIMKRPMPADIQFELIKGTVGQGAAIEHKAYMQVYLELPTIDEIKLAPDTTEVPNDSPAKLHALTTSMATATTKSGFGTFLTYAQRMEKEWQAVFIRDCLRVCNEVKFTPEFTKWSIANADVVF